ncbi:MAG: 50S ribosomal protein L1 [Candidatus Altiarchaeota archaeon]
MSEKESYASKVKSAKEKSAKRKFKQSLELSVNFKDINLEDAKYKLNLSVFLPKGRGKDVNIGVFADGDMNVQAKKVSKHVLSKDELEKYSGNRRKMRTYANQCYGFIAAPDLMSVIGKSWGIVLGPRAKMPQPVPPNADLKNVIQRLKNTVKVRSKKNPTIHIPVGVEEMADSDVAENIDTVLTAIERQIPKEHIRSVYVKTSMGEAVKLI